MFDRASFSLLQTHLPDLPSLVCAASLRHDVDELVAQHLPPGLIAVVDDVNTAEAFGRHVFRALKGEHITLSGFAADEDAVEYLRNRAGQASAYVAVGGGTVNDVCKYAAHLDGKPYLVFPTCASMNGYVSANASITVEGYKKTMAATAPKAVFCDMSVIADAPARLSKSGLGDCLARPTAQADWLLSHMLLGTKYNAVPFDLLAPFEPELFDRARGIAKGDVASIELLMKILLLSGFGMTIAGGSYPASQGEHMIAHAYGMMRESQALHGEEIGVTTLTMASMQEHILRGGGRIREGDFDEDKIAELFGRKVAGEAKSAFAQKQIGNQKIDWDAVRERLAPVMIPAQKLESILKAAEAPLLPEALGWNKVDYDVAVANARYLRERFTFLDIA